MATEQLKVEARGFELTEPISCCFNRLAAGTGVHFPGDTPSDTPNRRASKWHTLHT
jgi:hypothetical protein